MHDLVDKASFLAGRLCLTQGWFLRRSSSIPPGPGLQWRFFVGGDVGRRARAWLGEGRSLPRTPVDAALHATAEAIDAGSHELLFEASFAWGGLVARADALRRAREGWTLIEVKSGKSSEDGGVKEEYLDDIAYTACVAIESGLPVTRAALVLVNRHYRLDGDAEMFVEIDVTELTSERIALFRAIARQIASEVRAERQPEPSLNFSCGKCDYFEAECLGRGVADSIFVLPSILSH
jgi:CRISPR/Cas system-associated exonuclease Cas4 (RecB family)